jgi:hypothetical protein
MQIMGIEGGENCVRKGRNGRELLRRLKLTVGCNASSRRTKNTTICNFASLLSPLFK